MEPGGVIADSPSVRSRARRRRRRARGSRRRAGKSGFPVVAQRGHVGLKPREGGSVVLNTERGVSAFDGADRVAFELVETQFMEPPGWNQRPVAEERGEQRAVAREDFVGDARAVGSLQVGVPEHGVVELELALVDFVRVAVDVNEASVGEKFQQQPHLGGVGRRLQEERTLVVAEGLLAQEKQQRVFPSVAFLRGGLVEGQEAFVARHRPREGHAEVKRAQGEQRGGEFLLLRRGEAQRHVVHQPPLRHEPREPAR